MVIDAMIDFHSMNNGDSNFCFFFVMANQQQQQQVVGNNKNYMQMKYDQLRFKSRHLRLLIRAYVCENDTGQAVLAILFHLFASFRFLPSLCWKWLPIVSVRISYAYNQQRVCHID